MGIKVYNRKDETHTENNYRIYRPFVLGNPYTWITGKDTKAIYKVADRNEALKAYDHYFDLMYRSNLKFRKTVDYIYERYKAGDDVFLECYCHPEPCHGDIIKEKLEQRLMKEKIEAMKNEKAEGNNT